MKDDPTRITTNLDPSLMFDPRVNRNTINAWLRASLLSGHLLQHIFPYMCSNDFAYVCINASNLNDAPPALRALTWYVHEQYAGTHAMPNYVENTLYDAPADLPYDDTSRNGYRLNVLRVVWFGLLSPVEHSHAQPTQALPYVRGPLVLYCATTAAYSTHHRIGDPPDDGAPRSKIVTEPAMPLCAYLCLPEHSLSANIAFIARADLVEVAEACVAPSAYRELPLPLHQLLHRQVRAHIPQDLQRFYDTSGLRAAAQQLLSKTF